MLKPKLKKMFAAAITNYEAAVTAFEEEALSGKCPTPGRIEIAKMDMADVVIEAFRLRKPRDARTLAEKSW